MKKQLYIAYGSNLNKVQMAYRCPNAKPIAVATLKDHKLVFQGAPYGAHANVIPAKGWEVPVVIWEIGKRDEIMLDRYEGVAGGYYTKEYYDIEVNGKVEKALIYIMTPNDYGVPSDHYLATIVEGYRDFDLDITPLNDACIHANRNTQAMSCSTRGEEYDHGNQQIEAVRR